jgi:hypothetical protein
LAAQRRAHEGDPRSCRLLRFRRLQTLARDREQLTGAREATRLELTLEDAGIKLSSVEICGNELKTSQASRGRNRRARASPSRRTEQGHVLEGVGASDHVRHQRGDLQLGAGALGKSAVRNPVQPR